MKKTENNSEKLTLFDRRRQWLYVILSFLHWSPRVVMLARIFQFHLIYARLSYIHFGWGGELLSSKNYIDFKILQSVKFFFLWFSWFVFVVVLHRCLTILQFLSFSFRLQFRLVSFLVSVFCFSLVLFALYKIRFVFLFCCIFDHGSCCLFCFLYRSSTL